MQVIILSGSRNPDGQTAQACEAVRRGVNESGGQVETIFLPPLSIERCRQCDEAGWGICRSAGRCVIEDDFASLVEKIRGADAVVFATPVYYGDLSESLRALLDRLRRTCTHEAGRPGVHGKPAMGVCVAGGGGGGAPACTVSLERVLQSTGFDVIDLIGVRRQNLQAKLAQLQQAGQWLRQATTQSED